MLLQNYCNYVNEKINISGCTLNNYISTENMCPNKNGIRPAIKLPEVDIVSSYHKNDILISNIRPYFKKIYFATNNGGCSNDVLVFRAKNITYPKFLYYLISQQQFFDYVTSSAKGTKMPRGDKNAIMKFNCPTILYEEQKAIADVLSSFDDKIELNNKIIKNLEEQAQSLYKHWFVDFEFPDKDGKPYKSNGGKFKESELGLIPEDWEIKTLGAFFPVITGKQNANIANKEGIYPFFSCSQDILYCNNYSFDDSAILLAGNGDFSVKVYSGKFEAYQRTYVLIPTDEKKIGFLYYSIKINLQDITKGFRGSVIKFITKGNIENYKIIYNQSSEQLFEYFNSNIKKVNDLKTENQKLAETRDYLLPKLMSGEIKVNEIK